MITQEIGFLKLDLDIDMDGIIKEHYHAKNTLKSLLLEGFFLFLIIKELVLLTKITFNKLTITCSDLFFPLVHDEDKEKLYFQDDQRPTSISDPYLN